MLADPDVADVDPSMQVTVAPGGDGQMAEESSYAALSLGDPFSFEWEFGLKRDAALSHSVGQVPATIEWPSTDWILEMDDQPGRMTSKVAEYLRNVRLLR